MPENPTQDGVVLLQPRSKMIDRYASIFELTVIGHGLLTSSYQEQVKGNPQECLCGQGVTFQQTQALLHRLRVLGDDIITAGTYCLL